MKDLSDSIQILHSFFRSVLLIVSVTFIDCNSTSDNTSQILSITMIFYCWNYRWLVTTRTDKLLYYVVRLCCCCLWRNCCCCAVKNELQAFAALVLNSVTVQLKVLKFSSAVYHIDRQLVVDTKSTNCVLGDFVWSFDCVSWCYYWKVPVTCDQLLSWNQILDGILCRCIVKVCYICSDGYFRFTVYHFVSSKMFSFWYICWHLMVLITI